MLTGSLAVLALGGHQDRLQPVLADARVDLDVVLANLGGAFVGGRDALVARQVADGVAHLIERPAQVDGGGPLRRQQGNGAIDRLVGGVGAQRQADAVGGRGPDQRRAAHLHGLDRRGRVLHGLERHDRQLVRQPGLVDDLDRPPVRRQPDRAPRLALDVHDGSSHVQWSPPPLWGRDREGGISERRPSGFPPPLTPPHVVSKMRLRARGGEDRKRVTLTVTISIQRWNRCTQGNVQRLAQPARVAGERIPFRVRPRRAVDDGETRLLADRDRPPAFLDRHATARCGCVVSRCCSAVSGMTLVPLERHQGVALARRGPPASSCRPARAGR